MKKGVNRVRGVRDEAMLELGTEYRSKSWFSVFRGSRATYCAVTIFTITLALFCVKLQAQDTLGFDVLHYRFALELSDSTDVIVGQTTATVLFLDKRTTFSLDLVGESEDHTTGMHVDQVNSGEVPCSFQQVGNSLNIDLPGVRYFPDTLNFTIDYHGKPADGMIISTSRYGKRTFFGDNWPNRARHWLPCHDHPSDKATLEFVVTAPDHYQVVSNGYLNAIYPTKEGYRTTIYREDVPIPTKVMVIGVAEFAWETAGFWENRPIQTWVYSEDRVNGFIDYAPAVEIVKYFSDLIGPFAYEKLANVQSKTIYGGMENAGCIFYHERSVNGENRQHSLLAHEIAHQWFGNSVAEMDWPHLWLSEGFATYLEACYSTSRLGPDHLASTMSRSRESVIRFYQRTGRPLIDSTETNPMRLLNTNSYQKGAWFLHMLRHEAGEEAFWTGIRTFYSRYMNKNAWSSDFQRVMEEVTGSSWQTFFDQWLKVAGQPVLDLSWAYTPSTNSTHIVIRQIQEQHIFSFPLEIDLLDAEGKVIKRLNPLIDKASFSMDIKTAATVSDIKLDPDVHLLFEMPK